MRTIIKQGSGGYHLSQQHASPPQTPSAATSRWGSFAHKNIVLLSLLEEQYSLCCYSELRSDQEGLGYHIEHVENKSQNPPRTFDYQNLAASALDSDTGLGILSIQGVVAFGGHSPDKTGANGPVNMARFLSPYDPDSKRHFAYLSDGRIEPSIGLNQVEQDKAQYTIDTLNLNSPLLVTRRRQWWDELDKLFLEHQQKSWNVEDLAAIDLVPINGKLSRFFSLTRQFFGSAAESVLQQQAHTLV